MFYWLLYPLREIHSLKIFSLTFEINLSFFRIFGYVTFRMVMAAITSLIIMYVIGPRFILFLQKIKFKESVRDDGPKSHSSKAGTPTMGGLLVMTSMSISIFLWGNLTNTYTVSVWICTLALSLVGFRDDYSKSVLKIAGGMRPRIKMLFQLLIGFSFALLIYNFPYFADNTPAMPTALYVPFFKDPVLILGIFAIPFWVLVVTGTSNAVNLTDGLDGLAIGISTIVVGTLGVMAYISGVSSIANQLLLPFVPEANELTVFAAALTGAAIGFLWYNSHPAEVFMGDTGSLAIGGAIGMMAICIKRELLLVILGGVFVAEALSVILQVVSFKTRGKRIFLMAPLHHHFEMKGWHENKVVIRFWIVGALLALISISSLKIL